MNAVKFFWAPLLTSQGRCAQVFSNFARSVLVIF